MEGGREIGELGRTMSKVTGPKFKNGLPVTGAGTWNVARVRTKLQKSCKSLPLTMFCGFVTVMVLRGALGFKSTLDRPSVPEDDTVDADDEWYHENIRNLAEVRTAMYVLVYCRFFFTDCRLDIS